MTGVQTWLFRSVPARGHFTCDRANVMTRNLYNNHASTHPIPDKIAEKISNDKKSSFALVVHRWTFRLIDGIFLSCLGYVIRGSKGRLVVDPSA